MVGSFENTNLPRLPTCVVLEDMWYGAHTLHAESGYDLRLRPVKLGTALCPG